MSGRIPVLFNPAANSARAGRLHDELAALSPRIELHATTAPGDAERIARKLVADGAPVLVAAGGDGTLNEVVNGIGDAPAALGVLPVGTMNVLAFELGLPARDLAAAWAVIERGRTRPFDVGLANGRRFLQLAGAGLDAQIAKETPAHMKLKLGPLSYFVTTMRVASRPPPALEVRDAAGRTAPGAFVIVGNGRHYGGPIPFFRDAKFDDGKLDVLILGNTGHLDLLRYVQAVFLDDLWHEPDVTYWQSESVTVTCAGPLPYELDGEVAGEVSGGEPVAFSIAPRQLPVLA